MNAEEVKNTKQKILEVANELFAKNGFGGTSVREIAKLADVNLASINYHFQNKESLYWSVFDYNYDWIKKAIEELDETTQTTPELAVEVFNFFISSGSAIMNTFKIFLSDNVSIPEFELELDIEKNNRFGPPGNEIFLQKINLDVGSNVSEESKYWAMKAIFSLIVHFGIVMNTKVMKQRCSTDEHLSPENMSKSIYHAAQSHLNYIKENPNLF